MSHVNLRSVLNVLRELLDTLVEDESQKVTLHQRFMRHLEHAEQVLLQDLNTSDDAVLAYNKLKAAKQLLEDSCLADLAQVLGNKNMKFFVHSIRKLCEQDLAQDKEELDIQANESTRLLHSTIPIEKGRDWFNILTTYVPIIKWAKNYKIRADLPGDLFAGCTVAFMTFPQTMGYAMLAGLPPIYGLYSSFVPVFIYSMLGTSAEMSVGPAAMVALMIPATLAPLAPVGSDQYILYATFLSFFSGIILFVAGLFNGGFIVENILSVPLLTGWIQGAAILIVLSQMSGFLQIHIPSTSNTLVTVIKSISETAKETNGWSVLVGGVCLVLLYGSRKLGEYPRFSIVRKLPISLIVLAGVTGFTRLFHWDTRLNLQIIGKIPQGLPNPEFFSLTWDLIESSIKAALVIAIIGFMEGISLAKKFSGLRKYRIDVSQELRALGLASIR